MGEDHAPGHGLQDTGHCDLDGRVHILPPALFHDHGAVIQVTHALAEFFAILHNFDMNILTREQHRLDSVCQFVNVEYFNALEFRDPAQVEIGSDDGAMERTGHLHELAIDFGNALYFRVGDIDRDGGLLLEA